MKQSDVFRENAENCARLAEAATNEPFGTSEWKQRGLALANEQDWLDGEVPPTDTCVYRKLKLGRSGGEVRQGWRVI